MVMDDRGEARGLRWDQIKRRQWMRLHQKQKDGGKVSLYRGSSSTSLSKCIDVGLHALLAGQLNASPASPPRGAVAEVDRGRDRQRERRQPAQTQPASAIRQRQQTLGRNKRRSFASSKSNLHLHPPPKPTPNPPRETPKGKKKGHQERNALHGIVLTKGHPQRSKNSPHSATQQAPSFCRRCMQQPSRIVVLVR